MNKKEYKKLLDELLEDLNNKSNDEFYEELEKAGIEFTDCCEEVYFFTKEEVDYLWEWAKMGSEVYFQDKIDLFNKLHAISEGQWNSFLEEPTEEFK